MSSRILSESRWRIEFYGRAASEDFTAGQSCSGSTVINPFTQEKRFIPDAPLYEFAAGAYKPSPSAIIAQSLSARAGENKEKTWITISARRI